MISVLTTEEARDKLQEMEISTYPANPSVDYIDLHAMADLLRNTNNFPQSLTNHLTRNNKINELAVCINQNIIPSYDSIRYAAENKFFTLLYYLYIVKPKLFKQRFINSFTYNKDLDILNEFVRWNPKLLPNVKAANRAASNDQTKVIQFLDEHNVRPDIEVMLDNIQHFSEEILEKNVRHQPWLLFSYPFSTTIKILNLTLIEALISLFLYYFTTISWDINRQQFYIGNVIENKTILQNMLFVSLIYFVFSKVFSLKEEWKKYITYPISPLFLGRIFFFFWLLRLDKYLFYDSETRFLGLHYSNSDTGIGLIVMGLILQQFLILKISNAFMPLLQLLCCGYKLQIILNLRK